MDIMLNSRRISELAVVRILTIPLFEDFSGMLIVADLSESRLYAKQRKS